MYIYRPQTKFAKVMFLHMSVILSTGGSAPVPAGMHTPPPYQRQNPSFPPPPEEPEADPSPPRGPETYCGKEGIVKKGQFLFKWNVVNLYIWSQYNFEITLEIMKKHLENIVGTL